MNKGRGYESSTWLTAFIAKGSQLGFCGPEFLCFNVPLLVQVVPFLQRIAEAGLPTDRTSVFRRETIERDPELFQIGRKGFVRHLGEFVVDECLAETL
jgi:hypothetical protein